MTLANILFGFSVGESDMNPGMTAGMTVLYTKKEFIDLPETGKGHLGNEIIPEIDVPGTFFGIFFTFINPKKVVRSMVWIICGSVLHRRPIRLSGRPVLKNIWEGDEPSILGGCGKRVQVGTDEYSNETPELV